MRSANSEASTLRCFFSAAVKLRSSEREMRLCAVHAFEQKLSGGDGDFRLGFGRDAQRREFVEEALNLLQLGERRGGRLRVVQLHRAAEVEPLFDLLRVQAGKVLVEGGGDGLPDDLADDGVGAAHLAFVLQFDLAGDAGQRGVDVADTRHDEGFAVNQGTAFGVRDDQLHGGDGQALRDAGTLVNLLVFARGEGDAFDDLADVVRNLDVLDGVVAGGVAAGGPGFLLGDGDAFADGFRIVRADLRADAVLERGDDFAASGVVLGVGGEDDGDVELQANGVAFDLHVAFLHDVEERDLDFAGKVGDFVDGEDAAIGAGQEAVVHGELGAELLAAARRFNRVYIADQVGHGDVRRRELFDVAVDRRHPGDGGVVAIFGDHILRIAAERRVRVVAKFGAGNVRRVGVEQCRQCPQNAGFRLAAQAEEDEVVAREHRVDDLRDDRVVVTDDAREERFFGARGGAQAGDQVVAELIFDGAGDPFGSVFRFAEFAEGLGQCCGFRHDGSIDVCGEGKDSRGWCGQNAGLRCRVAISSRFVLPGGRLGSRMNTAPHKPLSALLSQILVAYTVELDGEFELRMLQTVCRSARLSLVVWLNLLQFVADGPMSVRVLAARALTSEAGVTAWLGCLERWGVVVLQPGKRAGFGSGRGIRADWPVRLTGNGETAVRIWPDLIPEIDGRWMERFGDGAIGLRRSLEAIEQEIDLELPQGLPVAMLKLPEFGPRKSAAEDGLPLPVLLSRVLLASALDFERECKTPISLCANAIRVLSDEPLPEGEIAKRTGCSEETAGIGWQLKPYIIVEKDPARGRGNFVRLSEAGLKAQQEYDRRTSEIEERWKKRFGSATIETSAIADDSADDGRTVGRAATTRCNDPRRYSDTGPGPFGHWTCGTKAQAGFGDSDGSLRARSG